nr:MAG TPA: hypothetical protein [Caudoviricetes sp.]
MFSFAKFNNLIKSKFERHRITLSAAMIYLNLPNFFPYLSLPTT